MEIFSSEAINQFFIMLKQQNNLILVLTAIAVAVAVIAVVLIVFARINSGKTRIDIHNTESVKTAEFKVIEEIIQTDSKNIIT